MMLITIFSTWNLVVLESHFEKIYRGELAGVFEEFRGGLAGVFEEFRTAGYRLHWNAKDFFLAWILAHSLFAV